MSQWQEIYLDRFYRSVPGWKNGTTEFIELCLQYITPDSRVLEFGAGQANRVSRCIGDACRYLVGIDLGTHIATNEALDLAVLYDGKRQPFGNDVFDVVVSSYVFEHLESPQTVCAEIARVLKPGGCLVFRTPNLFHYVPVAARLIPTVFHKWIARWSHQKPEDPDPYPTLYRMNTPGKCKSILESTGFEVEIMDLVEKEPSYGMGSKPLFLLFMLYERLVNAKPWLKWLRSQIFCVARFTG